MDHRERITKGLERFVPYYTGDALASIVLVKGSPGSAEMSGSAPFSGDDGLALDKALGALGWGFGSKSTRTWFGVLLAPAAVPALTPRELLEVCETVDPLMIVSLDEGARLALAEAYHVWTKRPMTDFKVGSTLHVQGRKMISVDDFAGALTDPHKKQLVWAELKQAKHPG